LAPTIPDNHAVQPPAPDQPQKGLRPAAACGPWGYSSLLRTAPAAASVTLVSMITVLAPAGEPLSQLFLLRIGDGDYTVIFDLPKSA
jgi:hypothetical protein